MFRTRQTEDLDIIYRLDRTCFPDDDVPDDLHLCTWWVCRANGVPVAYAGVKDNFLCRAGVLPGFRGLGLQKKLIRKRLDWLEEAGYQSAWTYTCAETRTGIVSGNNLIKCGFYVTGHYPETFVKWGIDFG